MWEFDGQWDPELTTPAVLWHRLTQGKLGMQDGHWDVFNSALKAVVVKIAPTLAAAAEPKDKKRKPRR